MKLKNKNHTSESTSKAIRIVRVKIGDIEIEFDRRRPPTYKDVISILADWNNYRNRPIDLQANTGSKTKKPAKLSNKSTAHQVISKAMSIVSGASGEVAATKTKASKSSKSNKSNRAIMYKHAPELTLIDPSGNTLADYVDKTGFSSCRQLLLLSAYLHNMCGKNTFSATELHGQMKDASKVYKKSMSNNIYKALPAMVMRGELQKTGAEKYKLGLAAKKDLAKKLA